MEWVSDERELKAAGAVALGGGRVGFLIRGWEIESCKSSILKSSLLQQYCLLTLKCSDKLMLEILIVYFSVSCCNFS